MKQSYLLACLLILSFYASAQPTLQQSNGFQNGTLIHLYTEVSPSLTEGNSGGDQTWDFSSLSWANPETDFTGLLSSATPFSNHFLNADVASLSVDFSGNDLYNYFTNATDHYATWGYEGSSQKLVYSNPRDILHYPFSFGNTFTDSYYGNMEIGYNSGEVEVTADGFGNLILPNGIFYNCLRVREIRKDTLDGALIMNTSNDTSYKFYVVNYPEPLCQVNYHHSSDGSNFNEIYWQDVQPSGISPAGKLETLTVFPNPCHDVLNINVSNGAENADVKITDALGRTVEAQHHFLNQTLILNTSMLPGGIYFLSIETGKDKMTCSFVKDFGRE